MSRTIQPMRAALEHFDGPPGELSVGWRHAELAAAEVKARLAAETYASERQRGDAASLAFGRIVR